MTARRRPDGRSVKNLLRGREEGPALEAAGAVGDMIGEKGVAMLIKRAKLSWFVMRGAEKRQDTVAELPQAGFQQAGQLGTVARFPVLPDSFQSGAVGKSAGGER